MPEKKENDMVLKGRTATMAERDHMRRVRELGCIICRKQGLGFVEAEIHHIEGKTKKGSHMKVLPLCFVHHRGGFDGEKESFVSRHPYKKRFETKYGSESDLLNQVSAILKWSNK